MIYPRRPSLSRRFIHHLIRLIENDSVRPFIILFFIPWCAWAILATFYFPPVAIIQEQMGHPIYVVWVWVTIPATMSPIIGLAMRHGGSDIADMKTPLLLRDWMGLWLQWGGHASLTVLLLLFEISAIKGAMNYTGAQAYAGMTIFAAFLLSAYNAAVFLLALQCLRKLWRGEELRKIEPLQWARR